MESLRKFSTRKIALVAATAMISLLAACEEKQGAAQKHAGNMVLALSWQPGFCETRSRVRECRSQKSGRFDTYNFSLHGLWPQPRSNIYCNVSNAKIEQDKARRWKKLGGLGLKEQTQRRLIKIMPGAHSFLHRHEWIKHGTCYSKTPETYFVDSLALVDQINGSQVQQLFERSIGKQLNVQRVRKAFDQAFGKGVGKRVRMACKRDGRRTIITEITLGLSGLIDENPNIAKLALASPTTKSGCPIGVVDQVGLQ